MRKSMLFILFLLLATACSRMPSVEWTEGVAKRGRNADPNSTFEQFYSIIVAREMPEWERKGYVYKKR